LTSLLSGGSLSREFDNIVDGVAAAILEGWDTTLGVPHAHGFGSFGHVNGKFDPDVQKKSTRMLRTKPTVFHFLLKNFPDLLQILKEIGEKSDASICREIEPELLVEVHIFKQTRENVGATSFSVHQDDEAGAYPNTKAGRTLVVCLKCGAGGASTKVALAGEPDSWSFDRAGSYATFPSLSWHSSVPPNGDAEYEVLKITFLFELPLEESRRS
jgi:hypothetical protein